MNATKYSRLINKHASLFYKQVAKELGDTIWQQDGARYHTAKLTRK